MPESVLISISSCSCAFHQIGMPAKKRKSASGQGGKSKKRSTKDKQQPPADAKKDAEPKQPESNTSAAAAASAASAADEKKEVLAPCCLLCSGNVLSWHLILCRLSHPYQISSKPVSIGFAWLKLYLIDLGKQREGWT